MKKQQVLSRKGGEYTSYSREIIARTEEMERDQSNTKNLNINHPMIFSMRVEMSEDCAQQVLPALFMECKKSASKRHELENRYWRVNVLIYQRFLFLIYHVTIH